MDELAGQGILFEQAIAQASWSLPSYATAFTGLYPPSHGIISVGRRLPASVRTLADILASYGYETAAFVAGGHLMPGFGLAQGFKTYSTTPGAGSLAHTVPEAVAWLDGRAAGAGAGGEAPPFFMLLHGYDVHYPYNPPLGFGELYEPGYRGLVHDADFLRPDVIEAIRGGELERSRLVPFDPSGHCPTPTPARQRAVLVPAEGAPNVAAGLPTPCFAAGPAAVPALGVRPGPGGLPYRLPRVRMRLGDADLAHLVAHYDGAITYADLWLGLFLEALERRGLRERTVIVVAGDHGEELGKRGRFSHGGFLWNELVHVPLVVAGPGLARGRRVTQVVELVDLAPTLLEVCGVPPARRHQGQSLARWLASAAPPREDDEHCGLSFDWGQTSLRTRRWHLICQAERGNARLEHWQLYDLQSDPGETDDVSSSFPGVTQVLKDRLADRVEGLAVGTATPGNPLSPSEKGFLRLFGYW